MVRPERMLKIQFLYEAGDALALFQLFFLNEEVQILADNININAHISNFFQPRKKRKTDLDGTFVCK